MHAKLTSLTSGSADSGSYLTTRQVHCLELLFTSTSQQLHQARPLSLTAAYLAIHESFLTKLTRATVSL